MLPLKGMLRIVVNYNPLLVKSLGKRGVVNPYSVKITRLPGARDIG